MRVNVTGEHVPESTRRDSQHCMIADAIRDGLKAQFISVDLQAIKFSVPNKDTRYIYLMPSAVQRAIIAFDQGKAIKPFTFALGSPISAEPMQHWPSATVEQQRKARAKYRRKLKAGTLAPKQKRHHAPREREYGVRLLSA